MGNPGNIKITLLVAFVYLMPPRGSWPALTLVVFESSFSSPLLPKFGVICGETSLQS